jgi:hypothetical protein
MMNIKYPAAIATIAIGIASTAITPAVAVTLLNGGLVPIAGTPDAVSLNPSGVTNTTTIPDWTVKGSYDWLYRDGLNATGGSVPGLKLRGTGQSISSPTGSGWFIALDGDTRFPGSIEQTLNGLIAGTKYDVTFWQAAGQQTGFNGSTTERWQVSLGSTSQLSALMTPIEPPGGGTATRVSAWQQQTLTFTAGSTSEVLKFLAVGTPNAQPPFSLLAGISFAEQNSTAVPEPLTFLGTLCALGCGAGIRAKLKQQDRRE